MIVLIVFGLFAMLGIFLNGGLSDLDPELPPPMTRSQYYLYKLAGGDIAVEDLPAPVTREQFYLAYMCGMDVELPEPRTRRQEYLYEIAVNNGGGDSEDSTQ